MTSEEFKALMAIAANWDKVEGTNRFPWHTKVVKMSVKGEGGIGLENKAMAELAEKTTQFIDWKDIETPDKSMIHPGEVAGYMNALSPVILTQEKNAEGKYIILDGRHRLSAWRATGYKQVPVVFSTEKGYK